ncbi:MAG: DUF6489 family protein [Kiloniellales bacterium]|nr:DUF6489 family protein [Kiloniellales bacterium]
MKIRIDIDCTPEEARRFFGLPDVTQLQESVMAELEKQSLARLKSMDVDALMKQWFPSSIEGWERLQKTMWQQMTSAAGAAAAGAKKADKEKS